MTFGPPIVLAEHGGIVVVRDDLLSGGTKVRALPVLFNGSAEYVYASPAYGYAQVALAIAAKAHGYKATIFCAARRKMHARTIAAEKSGARIEQVACGYMSVVQSLARKYCAETGARLLSFGLDSERFIDALAEVAVKVPVEPKEVWCATGSGVLTRALQRAWPTAKHYAVRVGARPNAGQAEVLQAPEKFEQDAQQPPPFPSCSNYDAKVWQFIEQRATPGALFWNVAA